jgi:hypothetical protein
VTDSSPASGEKSGDGGTSRGGSSGEASATPAAEVATPRAARAEPDATARSGPPPASPLLRASTSAFASIKEVAGEMGGASAGGQGANGAAPAPRVSGLLAFLREDHIPVPTAEEIAAEEAAAAAGAAGGGGGATAPGAVTAAALPATSRPLSRASDGAPPSTPSRAQTPSPLPASGAAAAAASPLRGEGGAAAPPPPPRAPPRAPPLAPASGSAAAAVAWSSLIDSAAGE